MAWCQSSVSRVSGVSMGLRLAAQQHEGATLRCVGPLSMRVFPAGKFMASFSMRLHTASPVGWGVVIAGATVLNSRDTLICFRDGGQVAVQHSAARA